MPDPLPPLRPIPIKEHLSILFIERGRLDDGKTGSDHDFHLLLREDYLCR